jgi:ribonuclease-3
MFSSTLQKLREKIRGTEHVSDLPASPLSAALFPDLDKLVGEKKSLFEKHIGITINHTPYYEQALSHRSFVKSIGREREFSNERLEFFGDSILAFTVAEYFFHLHGDIPEGQLTVLRAKLVNRYALIFAAKRLHVDDFIFINASAESALEAGNDGILADAIEAIIAAIYLDKGLQAAKDFIVRCIFDPVMQEQSLMSDNNYKSRFQEYIQAKALGKIYYTVLKEEGPQHEKLFTVEVGVDTKSWAEGTGKSKKEAEQDAAKNALSTIDNQ